MRQSAGWKAASFAGLILVLGAGCKDSHSGKGDIEEDGSVSEDSGSNPTPDGSVPDSGERGGGDQSDGTVADGSVPDATNGGGDGGDAGGGDTPDGDTPDGDTPDGGGDTPDGGGDTPDGGGGDTPDGGGGDTPDGGGGDTSDGGGHAGDAGADTGPGSISSVDLLDFGPVPCGGDAPTSKTFLLTNDGPVVVTYSVTLSSTSGFSIEGEPDGSKSGSIAPGTSGTITINASAVPASATAGQPITATATVTTNLPAPNNSFVIPLSVVPQGAHLQLAPVGGADWLLVQLGQALTPQTITLQNTGNVQAAVTVTQPELDAFDLTNGNELASELTVPAASGSTPGAVPLTATFTPNIIGPYVDSAAIVVAGPVCNGGASASVTAIPFEGAATGTGFTAVATTPLPNRANCGATGAQLPKAVFDVGNYTASGLLVGVSLVKDGSSPFTLSSTALNIASGTTSPVEVTLKASEVPSSATPGTVLSDFIVLTPAPSTGLSAITVPLSTTVQGSVLTISTPAAFTGANNQSVATGTVTVSNTGNYPASPTFTLTQADDVFSVTGALSPNAVPAGSQLTPGTSSLGLTFRPLVNDVATKTGTLQLVAGSSDVICGTLPAAVPLSGTPSTAGYSLITPSTVGLGVGGQVDCPAYSAPGPFGGAPLAQTVTFTNNGTVALNWTAGFDNAAGFAIAPSSGTVAPGANQDIIVTPTAIPFPPSLLPNAYGGVLSIATDIPGDTTPHTVSFNQSARGAVFSVQTLLASFGDVNIGFTPTDTLPLFTITNAGNASATVQLTSSVTSPTLNSPAYTIAGQVATRTVPAVYGGAVDTTTPVTFSGSFDPLTAASIGDDDLVQSTVTTTITSVGAVCAPLPTVAAITGTGSDALFAVSNRTGLTFASMGTPHVCNANRAQEPQTLVVTNYGNAPLDITGLALDSNTFFNAYVTTPGNTTATVPPINQGTPGTVIIVIAPKFVPSGSAGGSLVTSELTITTLVAGGSPVDTAIQLREYISCTLP
jgi:hypothetical protein